MKLKPFDKVEPIVYEYFAMFTESGEDHLVAAQGYNGENALDYNLDNDLFIEILDELFSNEEYQNASLHDSLNTVCDPRYFNSNNMDKCYIYEFNYELDHCRLVETITNFNQWFIRYPYPDFEEE